jgi:GT2 family glycosyltransferase
MPIVAESISGLETRIDLSVVIVNRNTRELLKACLESIIRFAGELVMEIIVVDNGSTDGSAEMVGTGFPDVRLIRNDANTGFAHPNNQGLAVSRGRYAMLLNSDTEVRSGALARLVSFMDEHPEAWACGPALFYPDGRVQPSCRSFPSLWVHFCDMFFLDRLFPRTRTFGNLETRFDHRRTAVVDQPMGAALLVRREVLEIVGFLDERFTIYYNDVDWCYRIRRSGRQLWFVHDAHVVHHLGATTGVENRSLKLGVEMTRNVFDYYEKHFGRRGLFWFRVWLIAGFTLRSLVFSLASIVRSSEAARLHLRYVQGTLRAGRTGRPEAFATELE